MRNKMQAVAQRGPNERPEVGLRVFARRADGTVNGGLLNLSLEGCLLASEETFEIGESLRLMVARRVVLNAHVRWFGGGKVGLRFADAIAT